MAVAQHIQVQTRTGYARVTLNQGHLLIVYFNRQKMAMDYVAVTLEVQELIYQDGWNVGNLTKLIRTCEPLNKANDNVE